MKKIHLKMLLLQPVVAFAGEHCHPSFYSTVHGAYLSGKSAAQFYLNVAATEAAALGTKDPGESEEVKKLLQLLLF